MTVANEEWYKRYHARDYEEKQKEPKEPKSLYAMQFSGNDLIKVGISTNVYSRVGSVKSMALETFAVDGDVSVLHYTEPVTNHWEAEKIAHEILFSSGYHFLGEWFDASPQDAMQAINLAAQLVVVPERDRKIERLPGSTRKPPPITFAKYKNNLKWATKRAEEDNTARRHAAFKEAAEIFAHTGDTPANEGVAVELRVWRYVMLLDKEMDDIQKEVNKFKEKLVAKADRRIRKQTGYICDGRFFNSRVSGINEFIRRGLLNTQWDGTFSQFNDKGDL